MDNELLMRYLDGNLSDEEKVMVTTWLDSDPENMRAYLALRKLQDITTWHYEKTADTLEKPREAVRPYLFNRIVREVLKIAAIFLVAFLGMHYLTPDQENREPIVMQTLSVPAGQRAELTLTDGTKVWLNAKSTLTFPNRFSSENRVVRLDGEGYFKVTSDKSKPFIVNTTKYDIRVWGTEFNLKAYSGYEIFETSLLEGSVEILHAGSEKGTFIKPNQRIYESGNQLIAGPILNNNHFLWKDGILTFEDESFEEMVAKLELYFDINIEIKNDKLLKYRCTGKFRTKEGVIHILKVLQLNNRFKFKANEKLNNIVIE